MGCAGQGVRSAQPERDGGPWQCRWNGARAGEERMAEGMKTFGTRRGKIARNL